MDLRHPHIHIDITEGRYPKRFIYLLISLLTFLFGSLFIPHTFSAYLSPIFILQFTFAGIILFRNHHKIIYRIIIFLAFLLLVMEGVKFTFYGSRRANLLADVIYMIYFLLITIEVFRQIAVARTIDFNMVAGSFCGFIMLAMVGSFILTIIEVVNPGAFSGINTNSFNETFQDLIYYSFVSILTIGYGDILPVSQTARKASMLLGIVGYFYNIFVIGITISTFMQQRRGPRPEKK
ncbi:MAG: hypothetical protein KDC07_05965 [Chitinophagaceae bacterium]|nr:hypothetical protein [Chitinophagaceae bacterium]MCB9045717.1 hypothetical protein [Chitinophagales bacterium]